MKNLRKKGALLLALCMAGSLIGACSKPAQETTAATEASTQAPAKTDVSTEPVTSEAATKEAGSYTAGTYTGTAAGRNGDITVSVTFTADSITEIEVTEHQESAGIADPALERIPAAIVKSQSLGVDAVTGCTITSQAIIEAVAAAAAEAGADVEALRAVKVEKETAGEAIEKTVDVVIVGGGGAGMTAAASAVENGASVIVLEKTAALGGNTLASGLAMNAADPEKSSQMDVLTGQVTTLEEVLDYNEADFGPFASTLSTLKEQVKEYLAGDTTKSFDSVEWHIIQTYLGGKRTDINGNAVEGDFDLISTMCSNSLDTYQWLGDTVGVALSDRITSPVGSLWLRAHGFETKQGVFDSLSSYVTNKGGEIMLETKAEHLIMDNGKVTGVTAVQNNGTNVTIHANAVILTTGGFGANEEMVRKYNTYWPAIPDGIKTTCVAAVSGDGIDLALEANAALKDMGLIQLMPMASALTGQLADGLLVPSQYYMFVNQEGVRFVNEYAERDVLAAAALNQTDGIFYSIVDQEMIPVLANKATQEDVDAMEQKGILYKADTLEELAEKIGCPAETLVDTIQKYNSYVDAGEDADFGKNVFGTKLENAPYYAVIEKPSVHHTMGGVRINTEAQVLNESGIPIEGLFAAGEVTGGIHAGNRVGGNAIADCMVFGRIAGANAAK